MDKNCSTKLSTDETFIIYMINQLIHTSVENTINMNNNSHVESVEKKVKNSLTNTPFIYIINKATEKIAQEV